MQLDPEQVVVLEELADRKDPNAPSLWDTSPETVRDSVKHMLTYQGEPEAAGVEDQLVPGPVGDVPIRIYTPSNGAIPQGAGLFFIHGGGWVLSDIASYDPLCRHLSNALGAIVVSIDYRRAPETKFPGPVEDCWAVLNYIANNAAKLSIDPNRLAIAGDSAGGNLAAVMTLKAKEHGGPKIAAQVLHVPVTDHNFETESYQDNADGYLLTREFMEWFWHQYLDDPADGDHPYASPLKALDLSGLPPALVQTCAFDPLLDEGRAYARRLDDAGVQVTYTEISGTAHDPMLFFSALPKGRLAIQEAVSFLKANIG
ncbi:MAG: alpha/beta hydrolase [Roseobacter sp.]